MVLQKELRSRTTGFKSWVFLQELLDLGPCVFSLSLSSHGLYTYKSMYNIRLVQMLLVRLRDYMKGL